MIEINGVELELDLMDADVLDLVQDALENLTMEAKKSEESERVSDKVRQPCIAINTFFDTVFGEGAAGAVFQEKMNVKTHMDAFIKVVAEIEKTPETVNSAMDEYLKFVGKKPAAKKPMDHLPKTQPATKKKFTSVK